VSATTAKLELDLWADVDGRSVGTVNLNGSRSGMDVSWTAQVVRGADLFVQYAAVRRGSAAWLLGPGGAWTPVPPAELDGDMVDASAIAGALSLGNRATAENRGFEYVEGARARHCRIAVDGTTFQTSFPQVVWLVGNADTSTWRGELDYWVFGDGEVGRIEGRINGSAQEILPHGLLATVNLRMTATDRDTPVSIATPRT
jgi:hypothetical protein